jgi:hypothetical protein
MNDPAVRNRYDSVPEFVTAECFNRGSSPIFAWIPAKNMRE